MENTFLSVIIPTHNRAEWLKTVVESLIKQNYPVNAYEILIVDNASQDHTRAYSKEIVRETNPVIRYIHEPELGISNARNCGALAARGEIIIFIDDDAVADPGWLTAIAGVFTSDPEIVCVGGKIELWWEQKRPDWFGEELDGYLGGNQSLGDQEKPFPADGYPFGGNLAIRKNTFLEIPGGFDPRFGHTGSQLGAHDETRIVDHLRCMGKIVYSPDACIRHFTPAKRATHRYLARRAFRIGQADADLDQQRQKRSRFGLVRSSVANTNFLIRNLWKLLGYQFQGKNKEASYEFVVASSQFGRLIRTIQLVISESS